jgi:uncharacterized protein
MAGEQNLERTKQAYAAFAAGDIERASADLADDIEWIVPGNSTISGTYRGRDEVASFFMTLASKSFRTEPQHFIAEGDHVVVLTRITAEGQSADEADVLTFRGDKLAKFQSAGDTALQESIWGKK